MRLLDMAYLGLPSWASGFLLSPLSNIDPRGCAKPVIFSVWPEDDCQTNKTDQYFPMRFLRFTERSSFKFDCNIKYFLQGLGVIVPIFRVCISSGKIDLEHIKVIFIASVAMRSCILIPYYFVCKSSFFQNSTWCTIYAISIVFNLCLDL